MPKFSQDQWSKAWMALGLAGELGWTIAAPVVAFTLVGRYLDRHLGFSFLFVLLGGLLGIGSGVYLVYRKSDQILKRIKSRQPFDSKNDHRTDGGSQ